MAYKIELRPLATIEMLEAYDWYELQKEGLGNDFLEELDNFFIDLLQNPFTHSYYEISVRQGNINRFPYTVLYEPFDSTIIVYSIFMTKQDPAKKRVK